MNVPPSTHTSPQVIEPVSGTLLVSVRLPPTPTWMTSSLSLPVIVHPVRSSTTAFVTTSDPSPAAAITSFGSVTVPPASSAACSDAHVRGVQRHTSPPLMSTNPPGTSSKKRLSSPADAPEVIVTGLNAVGATSVVTPMDAPAASVPTVMVLPPGR